MHKRCLPDLDPERQPVMKLGKQIEVSDAKWGRWEKWEMVTKEERESLRKTESTQEGGTGWLPGPTCLGNVKKEGAICT